MLLSVNAFGPLASPPYTPSFAGKIAILFSIISLGIVLIRVSVNVINRLRKRKPSYRTDSLRWSTGCLLLGALATSLDIFEITRTALRKGVQPNDMGALIGALGEALIPWILALSASLLHFFIATLSQTKHNES